MENQKFQFKTNINCSGCVASVKPHLDKAEGITGWSVDTDNKEKILTVDANGISNNQVIEIVKKAGFNATPL